MEALVSDKTLWLASPASQGYAVGYKRIGHLMGFTAIYRKPVTSTPNPAHKIYPYLLPDLQMDRPVHVCVTPTRPTSRCNVASGIWR